MRARATRTSSEARENVRGLQPQRVARSSDHCPEGPTNKRTFGLTAGPDCRVSCGFDGCYLCRHVARLVPLVLGVSLSPACPPSRLADSRRALPSFGRPVRQLRIPPTGLARYCYSSDLGERRPH